MIFDFYPWKIETDAEDNKMLYLFDDFSVDSESNKNLIDKLGDEEKEFFKNIGVDLMKIPVNANKEQKYIKADFAVKGRLVRIPKWQETFFSAESMLGKLPESISVEEKENDIKAYIIGNIKPGIVFKPPYSRVDDPDLHVWDSGYVVGSILITG